MSCCTDEFADECLIVILPPPPTPPCSHLRADLYYFRYDGGPVIWTIKSSHTPLVSGRSWNTAMMLLKSAAGGEKGRKKNKKQWGCVVIKVFFFFLWPVVVYYMCEWSEPGLSLMRVCTSVFFPGKRVRGYDAFYVSGLCVSYFHI